MAQLTQQVNVYIGFLKLYGRGQKPKRRANQVGTFIKALQQIQVDEVSPDAELAPLLFFLLQFVKNQIKKIETEYWWCPCFKGNSHYFRILKQIQQKLLAIELTKSEQKQASPKAQSLANLAAALPESCQSMKSLTPVQFKDNHFAAIVFRVQYLQFKYEGQHPERIKMCQRLSCFAQALQKGDNINYLQNAKCVLWALQKCHYEIDRGRFCRPFRALTRLQRLLISLRNEIATHIQKLESDFRFDYSPQAFQGFICNVPEKAIQDYLQF